jgi:3-hydroxyacyl-[acyl-carrier-protein] dehydratase/UDP-3-O-[3-hydroxymyristoyl] N-acetylglucosamine deacetylase/3-hydroxyacyl-[acyl-carrier-protein] dehydratase
MISIEDISRLLPHRFPFLLIDRVIDFAPEKSIVALKNVTCNEQFFQGHFPDWKIMPGVLIIEAIAQAGAVLLLNSIPDPDRKFILLSKLDKAKFKRMVIPGDQIRIEVQWIRHKGRIFRMKGKALVDGEIAAEGEIFATVLDIEELADKKKTTPPARPSPSAGS